MSNMPSVYADSDALWNRYHHNVSRHLLGVARHLQSSMMDVLQEECGHHHLRLGFAPYIILVGEGDMRPTELADVLGISRQACNQAIKQIEAAGYIERTADPLDGRAKQLTLSSRGRQLRRDGVRVVAEQDKHFAKLVGKKAITDASRSLAKIYIHLQLGLRPQSAINNNAAVMGALLPRLADHTLQRLMALTVAKGHPGLKLSFSQVLPLIGPSGGRMQQMAAIHDVSKQAINVTVTELENLGYLLREQDPMDARQVVLHFTARGKQLILDSVGSVEELENEFAAVIGKAAQRRLNGTLLSLYRHMKLEQEIFEYKSAADIRLLATQLQQQLGTRSSEALGRLLLGPTQNAR